MREELLSRKRNYMLFRLNATKANPGPNGIAPDPFSLPVGRTLAEIGRLLGEHESSVSRNLERVRRELRVAVEATLRAGFPVVNGLSAEPGLSDAQIAVCLEDAAEDSGINLDTLFPAVSQPRGAEPGRKQP